MATSLYDLSRPSAPSGASRSERPFPGYFCDRSPEKWHSPVVGNPSNPGTKAAAPGISSPPNAVSSELEDELRSAMNDFERGDFIELSDEQLERCIANGESPWLDESRG